MNVIFPKRLGELYSEFRVKTNTEFRGDEISIAEFGRFLVINQRTLRNYIKGERSPSIEMLEIICTKCGVTADWVLGISNIKTNGTLPLPVQEPCSACLEKDTMIREQFTTIREQSSTIREQSTTISQQVAALLIVAQKETMMPSHVIGQSLNVG